MATFTLTLKPTIDMTDDQFFDLCQQNRDVQIERNSTGELIIMPPTGWETGNRNSGLTAQLWLWNRQAKLGKTSDSSTGYKLPNGAERSPDAAWVGNRRLEPLSAEQRQKFLPLCPDFVVELRSRTDSLKPLQDKMQEYMDNGCQLGWLIDPIAKTVEIYRAGQPIEILKSPSDLSGEDVLPQFTLDLTEILN